MIRLLKRLNADIPDHYAAMVVYARCFGLPYVEEDLIEVMEFWTDEDAQTIFITLVTDCIEVYKYHIEIGNIFNYPEIIIVLIG